MEFQDTFLNCSSLYVLKSYDSKTAYLNAQKQLTVSPRSCDANLSWSQWVEKHKQYIMGKHETTGNKKGSSNSSVSTSHPVVSPIELFVRVGSFEFLDNDGTHNNNSDEYTDIDIQEEEQQGSYHLFVPRYWDIVHQAKCATARFGPQLLNVDVDKSVAPRHDQRVQCARHRYTSTTTHKHTQTQKRRTFKVTCEPRDNVQRSVIKAITHAWDTLGGGVVQVPCGMGKTYMALERWARHRNTLPENCRGRLMVIVASLTEQWVQRTQEFVPDATVAVWAGNKCTPHYYSTHEREEEYSNQKGSKKGKKKRESKQTKLDVLSECDVLVVELKTAAMGKFMPEMDQLDFDYVIVDECHGVGAKCMMNALRRCGFPLYVLGLSATPDRFDGCSVAFYSTLGPIIANPSRPDDLGMNVKAYIMRVPHSPYMKDCVQRLPAYLRNKIMSQKDGSPYSSGGGTKMNPVTINKPKLITSLTKNDYRFTVDINTVLWHMQHCGPTIVFSERTQHIKDIAKSIQEIAGERFSRIAVLTGQTKQCDRVLKDAVDLVVAQISVARQGCDFPWLRAVVFLTMRSDIVQAVGRVLRTEPGKKEVTITYLCDVDEYEIPAQQRTEDNHVDGHTYCHRKCLKVATDHAAYFARARSNRDGLQADVLECVDVHMQPIPWFLNKKKPNMAAESVVGTAKSLKRGVQHTKRKKHHSCHDVHNTKRQRTNEAPCSNNTQQVQFVSVQSVFDQLKHKKKGTDA